MRPLNIFIFSITLVFVLTPGGGKGAHTRDTRTHERLIQFKPITVRFFQRHPERLDGSFRTMENFWSGDPATSRQWEVLYADDFSSNIGVKPECEQFTGTCCFPADCLLPEC